MYSAKFTKHLPAWLSHFSYNDELVLSVLTLDV